MQPPDAGRQPLRGGGEGGHGLLLFGALVLCRVGPMAMAAPLPTPSLQQLRTYCLELCPSFMGDSRECAWLPAECGLGTCGGGRAMVNWEYKCQETLLTRACGPEKRQALPVTRGASPDTTHLGAILWWKAYGTQTCSLQWNASGESNGPQERSTQGWTFAGCVDAAYCNTVLAKDMAVKRGNEATSFYVTGWEIEYFHKTYMARTLWLCGQEDDGSFCAEMQGAIPWSMLSGVYCDQFPKCTCEMLRIHQRVEFKEMVDRITSTYLSSCRPCEEVPPLDSPHWAGGAGSLQALSPSREANDFCPEIPAVVDGALGVGVGLAAATVAAVALLSPP